jgi:hypothetical protein
MKTKLIIATLIAGSSLFAETRISVGIGVGGHGYAAPPAVAYRPAYPGSGYMWVDGYWDHAGPRRFWHNGYWARHSYGRSYAVAPRYDGNRYDNNRYGNGFNNDGNRFNDNRRR